MDLVAGDDDGFQPQLALGTGRRQPSSKDGGKQEDGKHGGEIRPGPAVKFLVTFYSCMPS